MIWEGANDVEEMMITKRRTEEVSVLTSGMPGQPIGCLLARKKTDNHSMVMHA